MRAKRSKKYRKLMHQYELTFGFREPYQVLVDVNFLRAVHSFKMDLIPALERTLQGKVKPMITKCSLAAIMSSQPTDSKTKNPVRPAFLPPPTTLPLRHCSHNAESTPIDEVECLLSLLCPNKETMRNKEHYILATADPPASDIGTAALDPNDPSTKFSSRDKDKKKKRHDRAMQEAIQRAMALRQGARAIPGVPIIYVKRSVMILEPMSAPSESVRNGVEKSKFKAGLVDVENAVAGIKRKREDEEGGEKKKVRGLKKAKGPNPLSVKKPKKRVKEDPAMQGKKQKMERLKREREAAEANKNSNEGGEAPAPKKRKRRHKKSSSSGNTGESSEGAAEAAAE
ncbi:putative rRNA processing protein [Thermoascus aurantiacus ATCC 26904]